MAWIRVGMAVWLGLALLSCGGCASRRVDLPASPKETPEPGSLGRMARDTFEDASNSYRFGPHYND